MVYNRVMRLINLLLSVPFFVLPAGFSLIMGSCATHDTMAPGAGTSRQDVPAWSRGVLASLPCDSSQVLLVIGSDPPQRTAEVYALARVGKEWVPYLPSIKANIGRSGFAEPGVKREGDGKTPSGIYPLEYVFGYSATADTRMPYRQATAMDVWVDDAKSPDYNRWVRRDDTRAASFEEMRRSDDLYRYGILVGYNTNPVVNGLGSAIFVHIWRGEGVPTEGCVSMSGEDLVKILGWLDPVQKPLIAMGTKATLQIPTK